MCIIKFRCDSEQPTEPGNPLPSKTRKSHHSFLKFERLTIWCISPLPWIHLLQSLMAKLSIDLSKCCAHSTVRERFFFSIRLRFLVCQKLSSLVTQKYVSLDCGSTIKRIHREFHSILQVVTTA